MKTGRLNKVRTHLEVIRNYKHPDDCDDQRDERIPTNQEEDDDDAHLQDKENQGDDSADDENNNDRTNNDEYEQDEVLDIVDDDEWEQKYRAMRHELFGWKVVAPNSLTMTKASLKGKAEILRAQRWVEEQDLDREKERDDLFMKIRSLRQAAKNPCEAERQSMEKLKQEQMDVFEKLEAERRVLEGYLEKLFDRILLDDFASDDESTKRNSKRKNQSELILRKQEEQRMKKKNKKEAQQQSNRNVLHLGRNNILSRIEENDDETRGKKLKEFMKNERSGGDGVDDDGDRNDDDGDDDVDVDEVREILHSVGVEYKAYENNFEDEENVSDDNEKENGENNSKHSEDSFDADAEINADLDRFGSRKQNMHGNKNKNKTGQVSKSQKAAGQFDATDPNNDENDGGADDKQEAKVEDDLEEQLREQIKAVSEEMRRLSSGGNFGWLREDHNEFLRIRSQHKNQVNSAKFIEDCFVVVPMYSREEIEEHASVFAKYVLLDDEKKELMHRFREAQAAAKKRDIEAKAAEASSAAVLRRNRDLLALEERQKKKDKIQDWKQRRHVLTQNVVEQELEEKRILMNVLGEKRMRQNSQRDMTKALIKDYKQQKEEEMARVKAMAQEKVVSQVRRISRAEVERIKAKEEELVRKQMQRLAEAKAKKPQTTGIAAAAAHSESEAEQMMRIAQINREKFAHVEPRLKETTKTAERRATQKYEGIGKIDRFGPTGDSFAGNTLGLGGRLKVPTWRKSSNL